MIGIFIQDKETGENFVLTKGTENSYPDIKKVTITLESLKDEYKARSKAKELYQQYTGDVYPASGDNTNSVLKKLATIVSEGKS